MKFKMTTANRSKREFTILKPIALKKGAELFFVPPACGGAGGWESAAQEGDVVRLFK
jgi:hypothetical protein